MNGRNADILTQKRRESGDQGVAQSHSGPGDIEAAAKEYNVAIVFTDITQIDQNAAVDRIIEDTWNGESWCVLFTDNALAPGVSRREVVHHAGFLRVRHVVRATSGTNIVGATFGSGITLKQA